MGQRVIKLNPTRTMQDAWIVAENWYSRLNNLKQWLYNNPGHIKRDKACDLVATLAVRLIAFADLYRRYSMPKSTPQYPSGGIVSESGPEYVEIFEGEVSFTMLPVEALFGDEWEQMKANMEEAQKLCKTL